MIIFLGAGASRPFGIPTMPEFIDIFDKEMGKNKLYNEIRRSFDTETFDLEVLMTILEDLSKDREELFRIISPQTSRFLFKKMREKGIDYFDHIDMLAKPSTAKKCLSELKEIIRRKCFDAEQDNADMILNAYDPLFKYLRANAGTKTGQRIGGFARAGDGKLEYPQNLKIFTTNYDTCIEAFLNRHQVNFTQGIVPRYGEYVLDVDSYDDKDSKVGVFKLHGSIDLFRKNGDISQVRAFTSDGLTHLGEKLGEEHIRYPIEFGGYRHVIESPYLELFRLFRDRLRVDIQSLWLLIGSSFRDITICSVMNDVLRLKEVGRRPVIIFVNPSAKTIVERLKKWGMNTFAELVRNVEEKFGTDEFIKGLHKAFEPNASFSE